MVGIRPAGANDACVDSQSSTSGTPFAKTPASPALHAMHFQSPATLIAILLCPLVFAQQAASEFRTWTSSDGKTIEAALVSMEASGVKLKLKTGAIVTVSVSRLSAEDQAFVRNTQPTAASGGTPAAESKWPRGVALEEPPEPKVIKEDKAASEFVYRSEHYEFRCDSKLGANVVKEFSRIFEATWLLNCKLPLDLKPTPEEGQEFFVAQLYTNKADYFANGGIEGSAGVYQSGKKALSVPLSSLGVKMVGSRVSLEKTNDDDNATLIHEITHQMMNHWLGRMRTWMIEGSAEAVEMLEYQRGRFSLLNMRQRMQHYLDRQRGNGKTYTMLDPEELVSLDGRTWSAALANRNGQASQNYGSACLLTCYFYYHDDAGDAKHIVDFYRDLEKIIRRDGEKEVFEKHLMRGRSYDQLKTDIKKAYRKWGIDIEFASPGKNGTASSQ